jgi:subtilisin family serine protease
LNLEMLEDRTLLSGTPSLPANVVPIAWQGQSGYAVAGQWIARFDGLSGSAASQVQGLQGLLDTTGLGLHVVEQLGMNGLVLLQGPAAVTASQVQTLARLPGYRYVVPNFYEANPLLDNIPNDTFFGLEYGMRNTGQTINGQVGIAGDDVSATQAWDITTGSTHVTVADIDTGIDYNHPDLHNNIWINQAEIPASRLQNLTDVDGDGLITFYDLNNPINQGPGKITDITGHGQIDASDILAPMVLDAQGNDTGMGGWAYPGNTQDGDTAHPNDFVGWNFVNNTNRPFDGYNHGTHTSGTIAAEGNNGRGVAGVNWKTQLMADKWIADNGSGTDADAISAVNYSVLHGAKVSSNSWHIFDDNPGLYDAINNARTAGDLFVCAAGNDGHNTDTNPNWPSIWVHGRGSQPGLDNMISVAATDNHDNKAGFSNYGLQTVNLGGPGVDVYSTFPNNTYGYDSGTSMATPHVAGAAALALSIAPSASYQIIRQAIFDSVDPIAALRTNGPTPVSTGGRLNVFHMLQQFSTAGPVVLSNTPTGPNIFPGTVDHVRFNFNVPIDPTTFTFSQVDSFTDPQGNAIPVTDIQPVAGSDNTQFDVSFASLTVPGAYAMVIGPNILDMSGNPMDQNRNGIPGEVPGDEYTASFIIQAPAVVSTTLTGTFDQVDHGQIVFNTAINPTTFTPDQFVLLDPNGNPVNVTGITPADGTNTRWNVTFDPQTAIGTYNLTVGPNITDTFANPMAAPFTSTFRITSERLVNGGFESGSFTPGWTLSGNTGATGVGNGTVHSGTYSAFLGPVGSDGFIAQTFGTNAGATYVLDYWLEHDGGSPSDFYAQINGTTVPGSRLDSPPAFGYTEYTFSFVAAGATTELKFGFREDPTYFHLDDVSVTAAGPGPAPHGGGSGSHGGLGGLTLAPLTGGVNGLPGQTLGSGNLAGLTSDRVSDGGVLLPGPDASGGSAGVKHFAADGALDASGVAWHPWWDAEMLSLADPVFAGFSAMDS